MPDRSRRIPAQFAAQLAAVLEAGHADGAAAAIREAVELDDRRLGLFLRLVARRLDSSAEPLRADELAELVNFARLA